MRPGTVQDRDGTTDGPAPVTSLLADQCVWCHAPVAEGAGIIDADHCYCNRGCSAAHVAWSAAVLTRAGWTVARHTQETL